MARLLFLEPLEKSLRNCGLARRYLQSEVLEAEAAAAAGLPSEDVRYPRTKPSVPASPPWAGGSGGAGGARSPPREKP
jgi:hypothetical protein